MEKRDQESTKHILKEIRSQLDSMISHHDSVHQPIEQAKMPNYDLGTLNANSSVVIDLQPLPLDTLARTSNRPVHSSLDQHSLVPG